jgi:hypothetical protein
MRLFERDKVYPSDSVGAYIDLEGRVVAVEAGVSGVWFVRVETEKGTFTGVEERLPPEEGFRATVRIYDSGGGWYPDDRIISWSRT